MQLSKGRHMRWNIVVLLGLLLGCKGATDLEWALELAGENRDELEKILVHYSAPEDSLKYRAACSLIENMPYYYYYEGDIVESKLKQ